MIRTEEKERKGKNGERKREFNTVFFFFFNFCGTHGLCTSYQMGQNLRNYIVI